MLSFEITEDGQPSLPAIHVADDEVVIASDPSARIRLPVDGARVRIAGGAWTVEGDVGVDGDAIADGVTFRLGRYRVRVSPAPAGAVAAPPARTESLARELVRGLLGATGAPQLSIERGPRAGGKRALAPPESTLVIGRGDEAGWVILDEDLSRAHAEVRRGWDGTSVVDLGSKNGTQVDGVAAKTPLPLRDGALLELGKVALRFHDPAERHLRGESSVRAPAPAVGPPSAPSRAPFLVAAVIAALAVAGIVWIVVI